MVARLEEIEKDLKDHEEQIDGQNTPLKNTDQVIKGVCLPVIAHDTSLQELIVQEDKLRNLDWNVVAMGSDLNQIVLDTAVGVFEVHPGDDNLSVEKLSVLQSCKQHGGVVETSWDAEDKTFLCGEFDVLVGQQERYDALAIHRPK